MRYLIAAAGLAVVVAAGVGFSDDGSAAGGQARQTLAPVQRAGVNGRSVADLRKAGPAGLKAILAQYDSNPASVSEDDIDAVAGQKDARWSRLYWYTDLDAAKAAARAENKPILYLRMLGKLTDEYSCANSRFFRTALYANEGVSRLMREQFVLVWQSERPVPVVTIDYGDGRVLHRTITGNSVHYVMDADGRIVDALPGLYDPETFERALSEAHEAAMSGVEAKRREHLTFASRGLEQAWEWETRLVGINVGAGAPVMGAEAPATNTRVPNAREGMARAASKSGVERPIVRAVTPATAKAPQSPQPPQPDARMGAGRAESKLQVEQPIVAGLVPVNAAPMTQTAGLEQFVPDARQAGGLAMGKGVVEMPIINAMGTAAGSPVAAMPDADSPVWQMLAEKRVATTWLDANSIALIKSQNPRAYEAPGALNRVVKQFQRSIAADTVRNEFLFRRQILGWLMASPTIGVEALNARVYSELFLTPRSDPWLGLVPEATYSALKEDGCSVK
jgi:hypothetical protein